MRFLLTLFFLFMASCQKLTTSVDIQETGQQIGDVMASLDESSGNTTGSLGREDDTHIFQRLEPPAFWEQWTSQIVPSAYAATCASSSTFSSCVNNVVTRTFNSCTIGSASFYGTVTFTFSDASVDSTCLMTVSGHSVRRSPSFTVTGRRGATLTVSKTGSNGQVLTKTGTGTYSFSNDGIRRVFTDSSGSTLFDFTTETTTAITVTGSLRATRVMDGGTLRITNNLTDVTCDVSPSDVSWSSTCTCASSGTWSGTCSDGKSISLSITGCGSATLTLGSSSESFDFDRCYSI